MRRRWLREALLQRGLLGIAFALAAFSPAAATVTTTTTNVPTTTSSTTTTTSTTSSTTWTRTTTTKTSTSSRTSTTYSSTTTSTTTTTTIYDFFVPKALNSVTAETGKAASENPFAFVGGVAVFVIGLVLVCCCHGRRRIPGDEEDGTKCSRLHELVAVPPRMLGRGLDAAEVQVCGFDDEEPFEEWEVGGDGLEAPRATSS